MRPRNHRDLPSALVKSAVMMEDRRANLYQKEAQANAKSSDPQLLRDRDAAREEYNKAVNDHAREAAAHFGALAQGPQALVTPSARQLRANISTAIVNNLVSFSVPTLLAEGALWAMTKHADTKNLSRSDAMVLSAVYAAAVWAGSNASSELSSVLGRRMGGATPVLRVALGDHANDGPYRRLIGNLALVAGQVAVYGGYNAALSTRQALATTTWGGMVRSVASGAATSLTVQPLINAAATRTLARAGVTEAKYLANGRARTATDGVFLQGIPARHERTTLRDKSTEVMAQAIWIGAAAVGLHWLHFADTAAGSSNVKRALWDSMLSIIGFYAAASSASIVFTHLFNNPLRHANKFGVAAGEVMVQKLRSSALSQFEGLLDEHGAELGAPRSGKQATTVPQEDFRNAVYVLGDSAEKLANARRALSAAQSRHSAASRALEPAEGASSSGMMLDREEAVREAASELEKAQARDAELVPAWGALDSFRGKVKGLRDEIGSFDPSRPRGPADGTLEKMRANLDQIAQSLKLLEDHVKNGRAGETEQKDIRSRVRELQARMLQAQFQLGGPTKVIADSTTDVSQTERKLKEAARQLLPIFAALRKVDGAGFARTLVTKVRDFGEKTEGADKTKIATEAVAALRRKANGRVVFRDLIEARRESSPNNETDEQFIEQIDAMLSKAYDFKPPSAVATKLLIWNNLAKSGRIQSADRPETALDALLKGGGRDARQKFRDGQIDAGALLLQLDELEVRKQGGSSRTPGASLVGGESAPPADSESVISPQAAASSLTAFENVFGRDFARQLREELPEHAAKQSIDTRVQNMFEALWADAERVPRSHRNLMAAALSTPALHDIRPEIREQHDTHFHPTSYSGAVISLKQFIPFMDAGGIRRTNLAAIPSAVRGITAESRYYAETRKPLSYDAADQWVEHEWSKLSDKDKARFDLCITGIDVTDAPRIRPALDRTMQTHPNTYKGVGEVTLIKEIVSDKNPVRPQIDSEATRTLLDESAQHGLPLILHCDRGEPGAKNKYADAVIAELRKWKKRMLRPDHDRLRDIAPDTPPTPRVIYAHAAGLSRFTPESNDLTLWLDRVLGDKDMQGNLLPDNEQLKNELMLDLSWDYVVGNIKANIYDQLRRAPSSSSGPGQPSIAERLAPVADGMQDIEKLYHAFTVNGSWADKAGDIGDPNLAALHRVAGQAEAEHFHLALENFKGTVKQAIAHDDVLNHLIQQTLNHGDAGNNWLYIFNQYQDRLIWGSDALSIGTKIHGDTQYELNVRDFYPVYEVLEQISDRLKDRQVNLPEGTRAALDNNPKKFAEISGKIRNGNYERFWDDDGVVKRRRAYESWIERQSLGKWSTAARPS